MIFDNNYIFKTALKKLIDNKINYCLHTLISIIRDITFLDRIDFVWGG